jgi:hypothetical protein
MLSAQYRDFTYKAAKTATATAAKDPNLATTFVAAPVKTGTDDDGAAGVEYTGTTADPVLCGADPVPDGALFPGTW